MPFLLAGICTLASCGDSHLTSNIAVPQPENPYVAVFTSRCCDYDYYSQPSLLYGVDRQGEITPLSPGTEIDGLKASPDGRYIAYWQAPRPDEPAGATRYHKLAIVSLLADADVQVTPGLATTATSVYIQFDWLPDSSGVIYGIGQDNDGRGGAMSQLLLAKVGEELPRELVGPELGAHSRVSYQVTADASALAVLVEQVDCLDSLWCAPHAGALYLADLASGSDLSLLESTTGIATSFDFQWSNSDNALVYQARQKGSLNLITFDLDNDPAGPVQWMARGQSPRTLLNDYTFAPGPFTPYLWLDDMRLVLNGDGGFEIASIEKGRLAQVVMDSKAVAVPSPDGNLIAYIASDPAGELAVYVLDVKSGVSQVLGPTGKTAFLKGTPAVLRSDYSLSALKWSPDGALLAWDRAIRLSTFSDLRPDYDYELYVHDFQASQTQRITPRIASERYVGIAFSWVSGENLLEYIGINGDKRVLMLTDPVTQRSVLIGEFDGEARSYWRIWRSASEVLWNSCEGIYLGELDAQWVVTNSKLLQEIVTNRYNCEPLDANREFAVMSMYNPTIPAYEKFLYDFEGKRSVKLEAEDGSKVLSVILLESE
jgi:hypothetical protein